MKNTTKILFLLCVLFFLSGIKMVTAQSITHYPIYNPDAPARPLATAHVKSRTDSMEDLFSKWGAMMAEVQQQEKAGDKDFKAFTDFYENYLDSVQSSILQQIRLRKINYITIIPYLAGKQVKLEAMYAKFKEIKTDYPSSIPPALTPGSLASTQTCTPACDNMNFATGDFTGWYGYYATNNSSTTAYNISAPIGGYLGAVTKGANDPNTNTYQVHVTSAANNDYFLKRFEGINMPEASPWDGNYAAMIGDSINPFQGVGILSQTFNVTAATNSITYAYSVFLENPLASAADAHTFWQQPFFSVIVYDQNGDTIPICGVYDIVSSGGKTGGFKGEPYANPQTGETDSVYWKDWSQVNVPLKKYVGQCVTIQFEVGDCSLGGHFGYAYVDASCVKLAITSSNPVLCPNATSILTATSGEARYAWLGPAGNSILTTDTLQNITIDSAGTYTCVVTPVTGAVCADTIYYTITKDLFSVSATNTNVSCNGGSNGTAACTTAIVTGAIMPFTYTWTPAGGNTTSATGLKAGVYTITVRDGNGCSATATVTVTQPPAITPVITTTGVSCNGGTNGTATVTTVTGGTPPYTYLWASIGGTNATGTGFGAGTYTITITDATGCASTTPVVITQPPLLTLSTVMTQAICSSSNGTATATANGGTPPYTYVWAPVGGSNALATGLSAGTYTATVIDGNNCTTTSVIIVTSTSATTATTTTTPVLCFGGNTGSASVTIANGTAPYTYAWVPIINKTGTDNGLTAGTYSVLTIDANGCTASATATVTQPPLLTAIISGTTGVSCFGGNNGTATATESGGTGPYKYSWNPTGQTTATATGFSAGTYTVTVTDANGCTSTTVATITQPTLLTVSVTGPEKLCPNATGSVTATAGGGTVPYTYAWSTGAITSTASITPADTTTYTVTITDANGCTTTGQVTVNVGDTFTITTKPASICNSESTTLCVTIAGGTPGYVYTWQPGNSSSPCITVSPSVTTTYTVTVLDNCGTTRTGTSTVQVNQPPDVNFSSDIRQGCIPLCIQFYNLTTVPGGGPALYSWSFGNGDTALNKTGPIYCYPDSGQYTVILTVTSDSGCSSTRKKINFIHAFGLPDAAFNIAPQPANILSPTIQFTDQTTDPTVNDGLQYWTWTYGDNLDSVGTTENTSHTYQDTGTYCVKLAVMDRKGCTDTVTNCLIIDPIFTLYIPNAFTPNGDGMDDIFTAKGIYVKTFEMYIFDRWGEQLYHTYDINKGWNGTVHGGTTMSQEDVYVYRIIATDWKNGQHNYIGRVTLLK